MSRFLGIDLGTQSPKAIAVSGQQHGFVPLVAEVDEHIEFDEQYGAVPDPATQAIYDQQFEIYNSCLDELRPLFE